jgi:dissimilatory sulfite reductase (desulfoviridin) alpha/beta subunit
MCGKCIVVCPSGTLVKEKSGYRIQLGGKLGRHPRLGIEIEGLFDPDKVVEIVSKCITYYKKNSTGGKRFADLFSSNDIELFTYQYEPTE